MISSTQETTTVSTHSFQAEMSSGNSSVTVKAGFKVDVTETQTVTTNSVVTVTSTSTTSDETPDGEGTTDDISQKDNADKSTGSSNDIEKITEIVTSKPEPEIKLPSSAATPQTLMLINKDGTRLTMSLVPNSLSSSSAATSSGASETAVCNTAASSMTSIDSTTLSVISGENIIWFMLAGSIVF